MMNLNTCWKYLSAIALFQMVSVAMAGPVTTVPWNGYPGAVSFTFDDGCLSQIKNAVPALNARHIHATFFLYDVGNSFTNNKAAWVEVAKAGHELANHSINHADFSKSINAANEVSGMAKTLRNADPSVEAVTFAYPYCAVGYRADVDAENIIGRGCLFSAPFSPLKWTSPPSDWTNVGAIYVADDASAAGATLTALDAAKNGGWISTLVHGVGGDWATVSTDKVIAMFDRAIQNGLWVGTYQEVAAYWRAGLTMDAVKAQSSNSGWLLHWVSPHKRMPKSVPLRVRFDSAIFGDAFEVYQGETRLDAQNDGSYVIEFMKLSVEIRGATSSSSSSQLSSSSVEQSPYSSMTIPGVVQMEMYDNGGEGVAFHDEDAENSGHYFRNDGVDLDSLDQDNYTLGWTIAGEWTEYTLDVLSNDIQSFTAQVATGLDSCAFHLEFDGVPSPSVVVQNTGGWSSYKGIDGEISSVSSGTHVLRFVMDLSYCNVDFIRFDSPTSLAEKPLLSGKEHAAFYQIYNMKGQLEFKAKEIPALGSGVWIVVGFDDQGHWLSTDKKIVLPNGASEN